MTYPEKSALIGCGVFGFIVCIYNWMFGGSDWFLVNAGLFALNILYAVTR